MGAGAAAVGQFAFQRLLGKLKRKSVIVLAIAGIIANASVLMVVVGTCAPTPERKARAHFLGPRRSIRV